VWPEAGIIEVMHGDHAAARGESGDLVCTGLFNQDMPLIRYRVGDRGAHAMDSTCGCQRRLPVLASVDGRNDDVLYTRDGRRIGRLDPIFKADVPLFEAQIVQESLDRVRIRYVPGPAFDAGHGRAISERLRARMGDVDVVLEPVDRIARSANGKMRAVICDLPADQRHQLNVA
jgi:phenylacetate-CoA ligase